MVGGPFGSDLVSNDYVDDGVPVIRGQNMGAKRVTGSFVFVSQEKARSLEANLARPGDVVFTQRGTLGQVSLIPDRPFERYLVSQSQMKVSLNRAAVDPEFFYYLFTGPAQQEAIRLNTIQTGVPHINLGILAALPVALPELTEQRLIAGALSDADALIETREQLLAKKRHLKQGAMQELLTGKKRLPGFSGRWLTSTLGAVSDIATGPFGTLLAASEYTSADGVPLISVGEIREGFLRVTSETPRVPPGVVRRLPQYLLRKGDIVFGRKGAVDRSAIIRAAEDGWFLGSDGMRVRPTGQCDGAYLAFQFQGNAVRQWLLQNSTGTTMPSLNQGILSRVAVALPPTVDEQTAIAAILGDMGTEIDALEAKLTKARQVKQGMMQELLTGRIRLV